MFIYYSHGTEHAFQTALTGLTEIHFKDKTNPFNNSELMLKKTISLVKVCQKLMKQEEYIVFDAADAKGTGQILEK